MSDIEIIREQKRQPVVTLVLHRTETGNLAMGAYYDSGFDQFLKKESQEIAGSRHPIIGKCGRSVEENPAKIAEFRDRIVMETRALHISVALSFKDETHPRAQRSEIPSSKRFL